MNTTNKISVITNFGCAENCWYCIWKKHNLRFVSMPTDWSKLESFIKGHECVSISGGGDPLFDYNNNKTWWDTLFALTSKQKVLVDVHTREKLKDDTFWKKVNKVSFSCDVPDNDSTYIEYLCNQTQVRLVHCVTKKTTVEVATQLLLLQTKFSCQLTFKQLAKYNDHGQYQLLKRHFPKAYFLDTGDYNLYYMPDNSIQTNFIT